MILKQKDLATLRANKLCCFCGTTHDLIVDHQHIEQQSDINNDSRIRNILCRSCNGRYGLGAIEKNIRILAGKCNLSVNDTIQMIQEYLTQDYSENPLHPNTVKDYGKMFQRLSAAEQKQELIFLGVKEKELPKNASGRIKLYKELIRGKLK